MLLQMMFICLLFFLAKGKSVKSGSRKTSNVGGEKMSDSGLGTSIYDLVSGAVDNR
jgi:hypothetical protein